MRVKMTVEVPNEAKKWLFVHNGKSGTIKDFKSAFNSLIIAWFQDLQSDYERR